MDVCVVGWVLPHVSTIFLLDFETVLMESIVLHAEIVTDIRTRNSERKDT